MKRVLQSIAILASIFYIANVCANCCPEEMIQNLQEGKKIYVLPKNVELSERGIFVHFNNQLFQTNALSADEQGIYILNLWPQEYGCRDGFVPCRNCDKCVKWYYDICPHCERPV